MKPHGKGPSLSINAPNRGGTSTLNAYKMLMEAAFDKPPPVPAFKPLASWPAVAHPRQAEIDAFRAAPSRYA